MSVTYAYMCIHACLTECNLLTLTVAYMLCVGKCEVTMYVHAVDLKVICHNITSRWHAHYRSAVYISARHTHPTYPGQKAYILTTIHSAYDAATAYPRDRGTSKPVTMTAVTSAAALHPPSKSELRACAANRQNEMAVIKARLHELLLRHHPQGLSVSVLAGEYLKAFGHELNLKVPCTLL